MKIPSGRCVLLLAYLFWLLLFRNCGKEEIYTSHWWFRTIKCLRFDVFTIHLASMRIKSLFHPYNTRHTHCTKNTRIAPKCIMFYRWFAVQQRYSSRHRHAPHTTTRLYNCYWSTAKSQKLHDKHQPAAKTKRILPLIFFLVVCCCWSTTLQQWQKKKLRARAYCICSWTNMNNVRVWTIKTMRTQNGKGHPRFWLMKIQWFRLSHIMHCNIHWVDWWCVIFNLRAAWMLAMKPNLDADNWEIYTIKYLKRISLRRYLSCD